MFDIYHFQHNLCYIEDLASGERVSIGITKSNQVVTFFHEPTAAIRSLYVNVYIQTLCIAYTIYDVII